MQVEQLERRDARETYDIIREITGKKIAYRGEIIKSRDGNLTDMDERELRCKEYVQDLFDDKRRDPLEVRGEMGGLESW